MLKWLFVKWGHNPSRTRLQAKLLTLLCILGAFHISMATLLYFDMVDEASPQDCSSLVVLVVSYKNDRFSDGNMVVLHPCSNAHLCLVATFHAWKKMKRIHMLTQHS